MPLKPTPAPLPAAQAWANQLACAADAEAACAVLQELFVKEDIPYGACSLLSA